MEWYGSPDQNSWGAPLGDHGRLAGAEVAIAVAAGELSHGQARHR